MAKRVTKKALNEQLRAVFGKGAEHCYETADGVRVLFACRRGESLDDLKQRLHDRLSQLPAED
jgi:hypothetical protein